LDVIATICGETANRYLHPTFSLSLLIWVDTVNFSVTILT
jgi:hypothetical protein